MEPLVVVHHDGVQIGLGDLSREATREVLVRLRDYGIKSDINSATTQSGYRNTEFKFELLPPGSGSVKVLTEDDETAWTSVEIEPGVNGGRIPFQQILDDSTRALMRRFGVWSKFTP